MLQLSLSLSLLLQPSLFLSNDGSSCHAVADVTRCHDSQHSSVTLRRRVLALCVCVFVCVCVCVCVLSIYSLLSCGFALNMFFCHYYSSHVS